MKYEIRLVGDLIALTSDVLTDDDFEAAVDGLTARLTAAGYDNLAVSATVTSRELLVEFTCEADDLDSARKKSEGSIIEAFAALKVALNKTAESTTAIGRLALAG